MLPIMLRIPKRSILVKIVLVVLVGRIATLHHFLRTSHKHTTSMRGTEAPQGIPINNDDVLLRVSSTELDSLLTAKGSNHSFFPQDTTNKMTAALLPAAPPGDEALIQPQRATPNATWVIVMASTNEKYFDLNYNSTKAYADKHGKQNICQQADRIHVQQISGSFNSRQILLSFLMLGYDFLAKTFGDNHIIRNSRRLAYAQKLVMILEAFDRGYEFVYWKDTDVSIIDCDRSLDTIFRNEEIAKWKRWQSLTNFTEAPHLDAVFTGDTNGYICTGNMWLRNTAWSRTIIKESLSIFSGGMFGWPWFDQAAIQWFLLLKPHKCSQDMRRCSKPCEGGGCEKDFPEQHEKHFSIANMTELSPMNKMHTGQFSVHYGGLPSDEKSERMKRQGSCLVG